VCNYSVIYTRVQSSHNARSCVIFSSFVGSISKKCMYGNIFVITNRVEFWHPGALPIYEKNVSNTTSPHICVCLVYPSRKKKEARLSALIFFKYETHTHTKTMSIRKKHPLFSICKKITWWVGGYIYTNRCKPEC